MELRHLRYFVAVAEESHFGRAAERLHVTQSTLSIQIQGLEREIGGLLFVRTSRRVDLTDAGRLLLVEARRTLAQADRAIAVARESVTGEIGAIRIGFAGVAVLAGVLSEDLYRFRRAHPAVELNLVELPPAAQLDGIHSGTIDIGYCPDLGLRDTADFAVTHRATTPLVVAVRHDHPLAAAGSVTADDLIDQDLVVFAKTWGDMTLLPPLWPTSATHRARVHLVGSTLGVLALAASGAGVAVIPAATTRIHLPEIVYLPLPDSIAGPDLMVVSRAGEPSGPVRAFLKPSVSAV